MTAATLDRTISVDEESCEFPHVLDGVALDGAAAHLAGALDQGLLDEAGWDPVTRILYLPAEHRLLGRKVCRVEQCTATAHYNYPDICHRCFTRLTRLGMSVEDIAAAETPACRNGSRGALRGPGMPVRADGAGCGDV